MVLSRITYKLSHFKNRSCNRKKSYNILWAYWIIFIRLLFKKVNLIVYPCMFGNHFHIGHKANNPKILLYVRERVKMTLLYEENKCVLTRS